MLKVRSISRSYGDFMAVSDVSFNIGKGEIVGLLGHNGAFISKFTHSTFNLSGIISSNN